ncbi:TPA: minor capsid protein [Streptococcus suis]|nr:minor capsid protein [Streptococcus suis]HEM5152464.1 minor capsid protein [Streptococcus suis]
MDNQKYWEKRKAQRMVQAMDQAEQTAKQLDEIHKLASRHITSKIDQIFESYRRDHGLTEDEAKRVLASVKDLSDIRELKLALQNTTDSEEIRQLLILLDSAPYASRIEKYKALQREVDNLPTRLYKAENEASRAFYDEFIPDAYYHSIFDLQQQSGVAFAFNRIDPEEIRTIQQTPWLGANYSERIWGNTQALANELQKQLAVSLLTGRSTHETAEAINAQFGKGSYNSRRLVRTEASHFHAEMEALAYEEAEVERYRLVAVLDLRTSSICREHDGEVYLVSERVKGKNYPPLHPWCRTVTIALDDEEWLAKATRSARDPVTGKTIQVPANMTYKDWYEKYVDKAADLVEDGSQKLYNQDMFTLDLMAKQRSFTVGDDIRVKTKKLNGTDFDFWAQDNTKKIRDTVFNVQSNLQELKDYTIPTVVFLKKSRLPGFAGYDYKQDILFVSDTLHSEKEFAKVLSDNYFAAQNIKDTMIHELTHKKHWDSAKAFYKANKKRYNNVEQAMSELNSPLVSYVKEQLKHDYNYLYNISDNAAIAFYNDNINELVAEVGVLGDKVTDPNLLNKVKEVLSWK